MQKRFRPTGSDRFGRAGGERMTIAKWLRSYWQGQESRTSAVISLILVNLFPIFGVLYWKWEVFPIMLLYWSENIIVGFYNVLRMILAKPEEKIGWLAKLFLVPFFIIHYGGFTAGHGLFVIAIFGQSMPGGVIDTNPAAVLNFIITSRLYIAMLALFLSHGYSFLTNYVGKEEYLRTDLQSLMMQPYRRVVLLHITLIIGGFLMVFLQAPVAGLILFVFLKTGMDLRAHFRDHGGRR